MANDLDFKSTLLKSIEKVVEQNSDIPYKSNNSNYAKRKLSISFKNNGLVFTKPNSFLTVKQLHNNYYFSFIGNSSDRSRNIWKIIVVKFELKFEAFIIFQKTFKLPLNIFLFIIILHS